MAHLLSDEDPVDERHPYDEAKDLYNYPLREKNAKLLKELLVAKAALRAAGIDLPKPDDAESRALNKPECAPAMSTTTPDGEKLPSEILLQIMRYSLRSNEPIIDPLSKLTSANMTVKEQASAKDQITIGFLAVNWAFHNEGMKFLWSTKNNKFIFTTASALRQFGTLGVEYRNQIKHVNFRIIAKYYNAEEPRPVMDKSYSSSLKKNVPLRVEHPPIPLEEDFGLLTASFRVYAWSQVADFLRAMQPPHVPGLDITEQQPFLLPALTSIRMDLVNFANYGDSENSIGALRKLHLQAHHKLPAQLHQMMVTGVPCGTVGYAASNDLKHMLKVDGLFMDGQASFIQTVKSLKPLSGNNMNFQVHRSRFPLNEMNDDDSHDGYVPTHLIDVVPKEVGHPDKTTSTLGRETVWKQVPYNRDSHKLRWVEFDRITGIGIEMAESILDESAFDSEDSEDEASMYNLENFPPEQQAEFVENQLVCEKCGRVGCSSF